MILTITMNPSVDISYQLTDLAINKVNRTSSVTKTAGGKGLNVTRVLKQFNETVFATGLIGGPLGSFITRELEKDQIKHHFFDISGDTRNCIALLHNDNQTEILESGPGITESEQTGFLEHIDMVLNQVTIVSISGSLPTGLTPNFYAELITRCHKKNIPVVLDTSGLSLKAVLESPIKPTLIKPNTDELSELLKKTIADDTDSIVKALRDPLFKNVEWIVISRGANGALAKHHDTFYLVETPKLKAVNPVGSGDSMIAGLTSALHQNFKDEDLLKTGCTLGSLNALEETTGCINLDNYDALFNQIKVTPLGGINNDNNK